MIPQNIKDYIALIGVVATALLGVFGPDTQVGKVLTIVVAIATAIASFKVSKAAKAARQAK